MNRTPRKAVPWSPDERKLLGSLKTPAKVQDWLDAIPYTTDDACRSPRRVMRDRTAHCMEGALFAAAALGFHGFGARILDLRAVRDDDHVVAVFRRGRFWGAVAKSNFVGLRYREPIHRTIRELVLSFFDDFFNTAAEKTLREYSMPFDLARFDRDGWRTSEDVLYFIGDALDAAPHRRVMTPAQVRGLRAVDPRALEAGLMGSDPAGLYKVTPKG
jgi:hypothetical protein